MRNASQLSMAPSPRRKVRTDSMVEVLRRLRIGTKIRADGPVWHEAKQGTPTMGGLLIVVPVTLITLALNFVNLIRPTASERVTGVSILLPLFMLVGFGLLGGIDDWLKLRTRGEGLSVRAKAISQIGLAAAAACFMSSPSAKGLRQLACLIAERPQRVLACVRHQEISRVESSLSVRMDTT